jgi:protein-tyrosine phosphatase
VRTELHFHLLPGVDDGPETMDESLTLARLAVEDGTATVVCTPHARDVDVRTVPERVEQLRAELRAAGIPLKIVPGVELAQDDIARLGRAELEIAAHGPADRRWVLLEAPLFLDAPGLLEAAGELTARGYGLLLGHPERCADLMAVGGGLDELLQAGVRLQVNGSSLTGRHGDQAQEWALELARGGRVSVVASDAHRPTRGPVLTLAVAALVQTGVTPEAAERMVAATPRCLLEEGLAAPSLSRR